MMIQRICTHNQGYSEGKNFKLPAFMIRLFMIVIQTEKSERFLLGI